MDVICAGQAVLDCITRGRELNPYKKNVYRAETIRLHPGGDAVNESMALAGIGRYVAIVCGLGMDIAGNIIAEEIARAGIDTGRIRRADIDTPIANLQVAKDGSRISISSQATRLTGYRIEPRDVVGAKVVSFASLFRPPLEEPEDVIRLIRAAKENGSVICADTKLPLRASDAPMDISGLLPLIDCFFPNENEAAYYSGKNTFAEMAAEFRRLGARNVIIKAGPDGCYVSGEDGEYALPAVPVENVVDTTGAGDNFVAGFISGILDGASVRKCAERGLRQAARAITHTGG